MVHKMTHQLGECKQIIQGYPAPPDDVKKMEILDKQMVKMQKHSDGNCQWIFATNLSFSKPVRALHFCCRAYQGLLRVHLGMKKYARRYLYFSFSQAGGVYKRYFWASASSETRAPGGLYFVYSVFLGVTLACLMHSLRITLH